MTSRRLLAALWSSPPQPLPHTFKVSGMLLPGEGFPGAAPRTTGRNRAGGPIKQRDKGAVKEGLGLSQRAESPLRGAARQRGKEKKKLAGGKAAAIARREPCGKGTMSPNPGGQDWGRCGAPGPPSAAAAGPPGALPCRSRACTSSTSGSPVPAVCGELRMTASGRPGAPVFLRPSIPADTSQLLPPVAPWRSSCRRGRTSVPPPAPREPSDLGPAGKRPVENSEGRLQTQSNRPSKTLSAI